MERAPDSNGKYGLQSAFKAGRPILKADVGIYTCILCWPIPHLFKILVLWDCQFIKTSSLLSEGCEGSHTVGSQSLVLRGLVRYDMSQDYQYDWLCVFMASEGHDVSVYIAVARNIPAS